LKYFAAAAVVLLVVSTGLNFYFFQQYKLYSSKYDGIVASQQQLAANTNVLQAKVQAYESSLSIIKDPNMVAVKMPAAPTSPSPGSMATIYWNKSTKDVFLLLNNMPQPESGKQYQLWAIVGGKPVDKGVFNMNDAGALIKMKNTPEAEAFAVTLEKQGGSPTPTMNQMYVMGTIKT
jgi:hypothetical protein